MSAWQASPDASGLWWRREGSAGPVLWFASPGTSATPEAFRGVSGWVYYDTDPRDGVAWTRCVPPDDAEVTALRARVEALTAERDALRAEHQRHVSGTEDTVRLLLPHTLAQARREGAAEMRDSAARLCADAAGGEYSFAVSATPYDEEHAAQYAARSLALRQASRAVAALPLPGDATPADEAKRLRTRAAEVRAIAAQNDARGLPLSAQSDRRHADELDAEAARLDAPGGER